MKRWKLLLWLVVLAPGLWSCSQKADRAEAPEGVIPQHQLDALNKAKAVEDKLKAADAARRAQVDEESSTEP